MDKTKPHMQSQSREIDDRPVLMLSVHNPKDRQLIKKFLPDYLTVEVSTNGILHKPFDLCILDHKSFDVNKDSLRQLKDQEAPIFLPFLLLSQDQDRVRQNGNILEFADDVVYIPATTKMLQSRIDM